jgi:hypothetical protein
MTAEGENTWVAEIPLSENIGSIQFLSTHRDVQDNLGFPFSSPLKDMEL